MVLVIDSTTTIVWVNKASLSVLGYQPQDAVGRSIADFLHPDDLERAAEVVALNAAGAFDTAPITPALYRVRHADGTWRQIELNGASPVAGSDLVLVTGRPGGDLVLTLDLLEAVTGGDTLRAQVRTVLELGHWRHPGEGYAICWRDVDGTPRNYSAGIPDSLVRLGPSGTSPWDLALSSEQTELPLADSVAPLANEAGFVGCLACHVPDPMHDEGARILIWTRDSGPTSAGHRYAMSNMARALRLVLQQRTQVHMLEQAARVDDLTHLASRSRFFEMLTSVDRSGPPPPPHVGPVLLYMDLDGFKAVNDHHGHAAGDHVLRAAATRIKALAPAGSEWARVGGDEFVLVVDRMDSIEAATALAEAVVNAFRRPIGITGLLTPVGASVGVAVGEPGVTTSSLLDSADRALLAAKAAGRSCWRLAQNRSDHEPPSTDPTAHHPSLDRRSSGGDRRRRLDG